MTTLSDKDILLQFLQTIQGEVVKNAHDQNRTASGKAERSLRVDVTDSEGKLIDGAGYIYWGWEEGRRPGGFPPIKSIAQWIVDKGISITGKISINSLAFLIARKIARKGTSLHIAGGKSGVVSNAITQSRVDSIKEIFGTKYLSEVRSEILKAFQ